MRTKSAVRGPWKAGLARLLHPSWLGRSKASLLGGQLGCGEGAPPPPSRVPCEAQAGADNMLWVEGPREGAEG